MIITYTVWDDLGAELVSDYAPRYLTPEKIDGENPLDPFVAKDDLDHFFGTKVLNIFIVGKPYGWTFDGSTWTDNWPPPGLSDAITKHIATYEKYTKYQTLVWIDFGIVDLIMESNPSSRFEEMMVAVSGHMSDLCTTLADYGFIFMGDITSPPDFTPYINEFYGITS
jgi:hypothetical protein